MSHVNARLELPTVLVTVTDEAVCSRFLDGSVAVTDITRSHG